MDKIDLYCNYVNLALCSQMGDHYMYTYVQLDRPWVFQTSNGTFFLCNFSQCFSKGSHFYQIVSQKRLCCADIFSYSLSIHFTMSQKQKTQMSEREAQRGNGKASNIWHFIDVQYSHFQLDQYNRSLTRGQRIPPEDAAVIQKGNQTLCKCCSYRTF